MKAIALIIILILGICIYGSSQENPDKWVNKTKFKRPKSFMGLGLAIKQEFNNNTTYDLRFTTPVIRGLNVGLIGSISKHNERRLGSVVEWVVLHNHNLSIYLNKTIYRHSFRSLESGQLQGDISHKHSVELGNGIEYRVAPFAVFTEYRYNLTLEAPSIQLGLKYNFNSKRLGEFRDVPDAQF
ncbi:MAG: hypothetical protein MRY83_21645 [Flavobacteriales bacterium]|nr:hypothetical protein [Flavobacteriales bacterium]